MCGRVMWVWGRGRGRGRGEGRTNCRIRLAASINIRLYGNCHRELASNFLPVRLQFAFLHSCEWRTEYYAVGMAMAYLFYCPGIGIL